MSLQFFFLIQTRNGNDNYDFRRHLRQKSSDQLKENWLKKKDLIQAIALFIEPVQIWPKISTSNRVNFFTYFFQRQNNRYHINIFLGIMKEVTTLKSIGTNTWRHSISSIQDELNARATFHKSIC